MPTFPPALIGQATGTSLTVVGRDKQAGARMSSIAANGGMPSDYQVRYTVHWMSANRTPGTYTVASPVKCKRAIIIDSDEEN